jgi:dTMP kinase
MTRGKFITIEGCEGVGKSTNMAFLKAHLTKNNISVVATREPGGTYLAEKIRHILLEKDTEAIAESAELLLMFAARAQHIKHVIEPALAAGHWVISDRFTDATYAYQGGGRLMKVSTIAWLENWVQGHLRPDLTLLLDAPVDIGMQRVKERGDLDRFETEKTHFFERVRRAYIVQSEMHPERIKVIKANQSLAEVQAAIVNALRVLLR